MADQGEETVRARLRRYLEDSDPFVVKNGHSLGVFATRFNGLVNGNGNGHRPGRYTNKAWENQVAGVVTLGATAQTAGNAADQDGA